MEERPIIIKRIKKKGASAHGGSWKVAYADFVTAMMAFFLLLWLLSMVSPDKRAALSEYFRNYSIFKEIGASMLGGKESSVVNTQIQVIQGQAGRTPRQEIVDPAKSLTPTKEEIERKLKATIDEKLETLKDQVLIDVVDAGVRIQIVDKEGSEMFRLGSADPTQRARDVLRVVGEVIATLPNRVVIEGHTDAAPFRGVQNTNWELSTSRASSARRELESSGLDSSRISRVIGYADQELLIADNPRDARNRRISIILLQ
jgi:chemotaxis protein MotB